MHDSEWIDKAYRAYGDGRKYERVRIIAALRSKEVADVAERAITDLFGDDGSATDDRLAAQTALSAAAAWLENNDAKAT